MSEDFDLDGFTVEEIEQAIAECRNPEVLDVLVDALIRHSTVWTPQDYQQLPSGDWAVHAFLAGRYTGKTDAGSHWTNEHARGPACNPHMPGGHWMRIIGPTHTDSVSSCVSGPTGLKAHNPDVELVNTKEGTLVRWPNGAVARIFSAYTPEDPQRLRAGGNSCFDWYEEVAAWRQLDKTLEQAEFGLRMGPNPRAIITSTPANRAAIKRLKLLGERYASDPEAMLERFERVALTVASTKQNRYGNEDVRASLYARYAGTHLGRQELDAEIVDDLGLMFSRAWFGYADDAATWPMRVRYWDLAATTPSAMNPDPDWTAGALVVYDPTRRPWQMPDGGTIFAGRYQIQHVERLRANSSEVESTIVATARRDGAHTTVVIEKDPGQAGKSQVEHYKSLLHGIAPFREWAPSGSKLVRAELASSAAQQGRVDVLRGRWNQDFFDELEEFSSSPDVHDDQVDALSGAFAVLETGSGGVASTTKPSQPLPVGVR